MDRWTLPALLLTSQRTCSQWLWHPSWRRAERGGGGPGTVARHRAGCCSGWISWGLSPCFVFCGFLSKSRLWELEMVGGRSGIVRGFVWVLFLFLFLTFCCGVFICLRLWAWQSGWVLASLPSVPPRVYLIIKTNKKKAAVPSPGC